MNLLILEFEMNVSMKTRYEVGYIDENGNPVKRASAVFKKSAKRYAVELSYDLTWRDERNVLTYVLDTKSNKRVFESQHIYAFEPVVTRIK